MHKERTYSRYLWLFGLTVTMTVTGCIDEDLSDCGTDYRMSYSIQPSESLHKTIANELTTTRERELAVRLEDALSDIFTDRAHDLALSFYTTDSVLTHHEKHRPEANSASFTIYLPQKQYIHTAVANEETDPAICADLNQHAGQACLQYFSLEDTLPSHTTGIFTARRLMDAKGEEADLHTILYMQNCASALVINPGYIETKSIWGYVEGTATGFQTGDSTYRFAEKALPLKANTLADTGSDLKCLYAVSFPSRDGTRNIRENRKENCWNFLVYVTLPNGKTTETRLYMKEPLQAGDMQIIKAAINDQGGIIPDNPQVGVSIELDWKPGGTFNPEV